jgi:hypothetical protein
VKTTTAFSDDNPNACVIMWLIACCDIVNLGCDRRLVLCGVCEIGVKFSWKSLCYR